MKNYLPPFAARLARQAVRDMRYYIADARDRLSNRNSMIPPRSMVFVGVGDFVAVGEEFKRYFVELAELKPQHQVLDVGCGIGRMAIPLTSYLSAAGGYCGIDIVKNGIRWCNSRIAPRYPNFRFIHTDIYNKLYNPYGRGRANTYRFPFDDASFDFVFLTSVFTHMLPEDLAHYLDEISRVLRPGGRMLATYFILNDESNAQVKAGKGSFAFLREPGGYSVANRQVPENAVAYDEEDVLAQLDRTRLDIRHPIHYGSWCDRPRFLSFQDIVIAEKRR
ncbi:MAG TPA: class I SAM-dependent methyltransferase [Xanthomonadaceae bacterium]|nr:class I SAM-dependent methyltransferase [Xanthomonadaceae bacterium]